MWNRQTLTFHLRMQPIGRTMPFTSKDEPIAVGVFNIPIRMIRACSQKPKPFWSCRAELESLPVFMVVDVERLPVVHPTSPKMFIRNREAKWMNQMQAALGDRTKATDVTRILGDFRIKKDDVKHTLLNEVRSPIQRKHRCQEVQAVEQTYEDS